MNCPACRSALESLQIENFQIDQCPQCRGVWLDYGEIDDLLRLNKIPERFLSQELYREPPSVVSEGHRVCPRCEELLKTIEVDGIILDACSGCKGFFADLGELRSLAESAERRYREAHSDDLEEESEEDSPERQETTRELTFE